MKLLNTLIFCLFTLTLSACTENKQHQAVAHHAVAINSHDECHLCGMLISRFDGPKGELYSKASFDEEGAKHAKKFCSTRDMFAFYLDPENTRNTAAMFVHDMSKMPWNKLNDHYFVDAKKAWYVAGSSKIGAMGKTLASFSVKNDAQAFAKKFGGKILRFKQINLAVLM